MAPTPPLETAEARKARHFDTLRRLGTLAMDLAQDAHALAKQQLAPRPRPAGLPANVAAATDYARTFAMLSRAVRQAIALEIRRETEPRARPAFRPLGAPLDPRRPLLRTVFHAAIAADPDRARLRPEIDRHIDHQLTADPDQCRPIQEIVTDLVNSLGIDIDPARVPDALLGIPPRNRGADPRRVGETHHPPP